MLKKIENFDMLQFKNWNNIQVGKKKITSRWGKTFIYYDTKNKVLAYENLNIFQRIFRFIFGYKKYLNKNNLFDYLKSKNIVQQTECPRKGFRKLVGEKLGTLQTHKDVLYRSLSEDSPKAEEEAIQLFKEGKLDPNIVLNNGASVLSQACTTGRFELAKYLIENGADVNRAGKGKQPFDTLLEFINPPKEPSLLNQGVSGMMAFFRQNPSQPKEKVKTPEDLKRAQKLALLMIEKSLDLNPKNEKLIPLCLAIGAYMPDGFNTMPLIKKLLEKHHETGVDVNTKNIEDETPLELACKKGCLEIVKSLVGAGADLKSYGAKALDEAVKSGDLATIRYLLDQGVSTTEGAPLILALRPSQVNPEIIQLLIDHKADISAPPAWPPLCIAVACSQGATELLLKAGARLDPKAASLVWQMHIMEKKSMIELLLKYQPSLADDVFPNDSPNHKTTKDYLKEIARSL